MRLPVLSIAAAIALLAAIPVASALTLQTSKSPADDDAPINDPGTTHQNLRSQPAEDNGYTTKLGGTTLHFGISQPHGGASGGNNWFLDSPASRTVPSQAH